MKENKGLSASLPGGLNFGIPGEDGATFTPSVDDDGNLSWSNDKGLENPDTKNIRGPQGKTGPEGPQGPAGTATDEQVAQAVSAYLVENPVETPEVDLTGYVKSVNGTAPDENGDVEVEIPEGFSGSWNDLTDKPFGKQSGQVIIPETTIEMPDMVVSQALISVEKIVSFTEGRQYRVNYAGNEYQVTAVSVNGLAEFADKTWGGIVYIDIDYIRGVYTIEDTGGGGRSVVVSVEEIASTKTLDEVYIPDTIARKEDIPDSVVNPSAATVGQTIVVKTVDENGKPTEWEAADLPEAYTLSAATANTLGGVKAPAATEDMTQSVGIDENGFLLTAPGGGGATIYLIEYTTVESVVYADIPLSDEAIEKINNCQWCRIDLYIPQNQDSTETAFGNIRADFYAKTWARHCLFLNIPLIPTANCGTGHGALSILMPQGFNTQNAAANRIFGSYYRLNFSGAQDINYNTSTLDLHSGDTFRITGTEATPVTAGTIVKIYAIGERKVVEL